jgi:cell division protein FtsL
MYLYCGGNYTFHIILFYFILASEWIIVIKQHKGRLIVNRLIYVNIKKKLKKKLKHFDLKQKLTSF